MGHRGLAPNDERLFAEEQVPVLRAAVHDLSWLLSRHYAGVASLALVGDRYALEARQRMAVFRSACADGALALRQERQRAPEEAEGAEIALDGLNLLTTLEVGLSGGVILRGRDGCYRDVASVHGSYRKVEETPRAALHLGEFLAALRPARVVWYVDAPVSNSGRLRALLLDIFATQGWDFTVELAPSPDALLLQWPGLVVTADSAILERCRGWLNVSPSLLATCAPGARVLDLAPALVP
jgi:hypothetical protein